MKRYYYKSSVSDFIALPVTQILGELTKEHEFPVELSQKNAWTEQIDILKRGIDGFSGTIYFEYHIPRMGRRIDVVLIIEHLLFIVEFKIGEKKFNADAIDQVWDYALDLKNFHQSSHDKMIVPILVATKAKPKTINIPFFSDSSNEVCTPVCCGEFDLGSTIRTILDFVKCPSIDVDEWDKGRYAPTPTIIEAAIALYNGHSVSEITRTDAQNLGKTSDFISRVIEQAKKKEFKAICFITGVPGSGKTLVGLDVATKHIEENKAIQSVFLSGNGPLVAVLREALARDHVKRQKVSGKKVTKGDAMRPIKSFVQNVHNFRDECIRDGDAPPPDHIAIFDEAQRAWNFAKTVDFMRRRKGIPDFGMSEPEFLISCLDRHPDWAVIVCLVGGGQEINTGEAGISEWLASISKSFPNWRVFMSDRLIDTEYATEQAVDEMRNKDIISFEKDLHLSVSIRSFRAENLSSLVKSMLDLDISSAKQQLQQLSEKYPIVITRELTKAKSWLRTKAKGSERYGIVVSSQAQRLKPHAIDIRTPVDPIHWFLNGKEDVRSSYYLEDVATEFQVQGLELDWACVTWDADFRYAEGEWRSYSFVGDKWQNINKNDRKMYLKNAYRVLLTRARQGMVIVVPPGEASDPTRDPAFYQPVYDYLGEIGFQEI